MIERKERTKKMGEEVIVWAATSNSMLNTVGKGAVGKAMVYVLWKEWNARLHDRESRRKEIEGLVTAKMNLLEGFQLQLVLLDW